MSFVMTQARLLMSRVDTFYLIMELQGLRQTALSDYLSICLSVFSSSFFVRDRLQISGVLPGFRVVYSIVRLDCGRLPRGAHAHSCPNPKPFFFLFPACLLTPSNCFVGHLIVRMMEDFDLNRMFGSGKEKEIDKNKRKPRKSKGRKSQERVQGRIQGRILGRVLQGWVQARVRERVQGRTQKTFQGRIQGKYGRRRERYGRSGRRFIIGGSIKFESGWLI